MPFLRQSTSQTVRFGPFLDISDGVTEETGLTIAQADMRLSKDGGAFAQKNAAGNATHDSDGWYSTSLDATDTDTVGELILNVHQPANTLPVWMRWWVLEESIYDSLFGASAAGFGSNQRVDVGSIGGSTVAANALSRWLSDTEQDTCQATGQTATNIRLASGADATDDEYNGQWIMIYGGTGEAQARQIVDYDGTNKDATVFPALGTVCDGTSNYVIIPLGAPVIDANGRVDVGSWVGGTPNALVSGAVDADVSAMQAGTITAAAIATDAIDDDAIATGAIASTAFAAGAIDAAAIATDAIDADALATDAVDEIKDAIMPVQNSAFSDIEFLFVDSTDHVTPVTAASGTGVTRSIDGGSFGAGTGTLAEVGNGIYQYDASAADMNGKIITFRFTATGGTPNAPDDAFVTIVTGG